MSGEVPNDLLITLRDSSLQIPWLIFFTYIILKWKHKYEKTITIACSFILSKLFATDSSISPNEYSTQYFCNLPVPWFRLTPIDLAFRLIFHWFKTIFDQIRQFINKCNQNIAVRSMAARLKRMSEVLAKPITGYKSSFATSTCVQRSTAGAFMAYVPFRKSSQKMSWQEMCCFKLEKLCRILLLLGGFFSKFPMSTPIHFIQYYVPLGAIHWVWSNLTHYRSITAITIFTILHIYFIERS